MAPRDYDGLIVDLDGGRRAHVRGGNSALSRLARALPAPAGARGGGSGAAPGDRARRLELVGHAEARRAEIVVGGSHDGFHYAELQAATTAIAHGAALFATGARRRRPDARRAPATGGILAAVETGTGVTAVVVGKPEPFVFEIARETLRDCERVAARRQPRLGRRRREAGRPRCDPRAHGAPRPGTIWRRPRSGPTSSS